MENASKALLIAGAILIAILLIGIGMMVFNSITGVTGQVGQQADAMEIQMFNSKFEKYEGTRVSGSNVKALVRDINANNVSYVDDESMQITVKGNGSGLTSSTWGKGKPVTVTGIVNTNASYSVTAYKNIAGYICEIEITKNTR